MVRKEAQLSCKIHKSSLSGQYTGINCDESVLAFTRLLSLDTLTTSDSYSENGMSGIDKVNTVPDDGGWLPEKHDP